MYVVTFLDTLELPALTKSMLVEALSTRLGVNDRESSELVDTFFTLIHERLCDGEDVKLTEFGNFEVRTKGERPGRNPRTGASVRIAPRKVVTFSPGPKLKRRMMAGTLSEPATSISRPKTVRRDFGTTNATAVDPN